MTLWPSVDLAQLERDLRDAQDFSEDHERTCPDPGPFCEQCMQHLADVETAEARLDAATSQQPHRQPFGHLGDFGDDAA